MTNTLFNFKSMSKKMTEWLGLKWLPIGVKFSNEHNEASQRPLNASICEALNIVKRENKSVTITRETCSCRGGRHFTGLEILPAEALAPAVTTQKHRVYKSGDVTDFYKQTAPTSEKRGNADT